MKCPRCQQPNPPGSNFCLGCGAGLGLTCSACGNDLPAGSRFCNKCGTATAVEPAGPARFVSPESYTPKHLAEKILTSKAALEGERKQVTVLFADLKGSMELLADRDPEEARRLLDPVLERMMDAVHRYEGTVNQVMGDGIMALFGAPLAHEDHAVRACYAALDMQASIRRYAEEVRRSHGVKVQIRVGLNSGEVVVRAIGSDLHMDYTAVGHSTHLAGRMEQLADPGTILLAADTFRLSEGYLTVKPLGPVPVKGLEAPVEIYELTGAGPLRSRLHAAAAQGLTRFVGREGELEQLRQALSRANGGHGQVVAIVGEPGVGKSRLVWEVTHSHRLHGWLVLQAGSVSYGKATSYLPVIDLLKGYFKIQDRDDLAEVREKVTGKVLTPERALEPTLPALLALLDVPVDDAAWAALDPGQRRQRTLDAVRQLLLREAREQPLLLIFEDLHWIDSETQALLDGLVDSLPAARLLLLVNYRPEYQHPWGSRTSYTQLRLDPLPHDPAAEILGTLLGSDAGLDPLKRVLIARTEGNPFFLEESVRALVETGSLIGERGAYRLARPLPAIQVPATVQAVLAARIDRLPPRDKALLQTASVVGKDVPFVLLGAIAEPAGDELRAGIGRLQAAEFMYEAGIFPDLEYTFKHALTHEVAYGSLLQDRRRTLHRRIAETIERRYPDRLPEHVDRLAHHAVRGEVWEKAVAYLRQAGTRAAARSVHQEAMSHFEQALAALKHLPETRETLEHATDLRLDIRNSLWLLGELDKMLGYLREAEALARTLNDPRRLGWVSVYLSHYFWLTGDSAQARMSGQSAHAIAHTVGDLALQVAATTYLGVACLTSGDYRQAEDLFRDVVESLDGELERERCGLPFFPVPFCHAFWGWALAERGVFDESIAHGQDAVRVMEELDHPYTRVIASWGLASLYVVKGEFSHSVQPLERGLALCHDLFRGPATANTMELLGHTYALSGRVQAGVSLLEQALQAIAPTGAGTWHSLSVVNLAEAYAVAGRLVDARALAEQALTLTRERGQRGWQVRALRLLGEMASGPDSPDVETAQRHYRQALGLADELGMRPLVAHCHLGLGKLYRRTGKHEQAQEQLTTATTMYREMGMTYWLEQAEPEMRELG